MSSCCGSGKKEVCRVRGIPGADAEALVDRGFAQQVGNKLQRANRLLGKFLDEQANEGDALARLFGSSETYRQNLRRVLESRIGLVVGMDATLRRFLERGAEDLPDHPELFLGNVHGILEQTLTLIWRNECWDKARSKPHIPSDWFAIWRRNDEKNFEDWQTRFPEGGPRMRLLDLMTGTQRTDRLAKKITKNTYVLANAVQGFRDFGVHPKAVKVEVGVAYAALHVCIELAAAVTMELGSDDSRAS
jgi:hypothetical protein